VGEVEYVVYIIVPSGVAVVSPRLGSSDWRLQRAGREKSSSSCATASNTEVKKGEEAGGGGREGRTAGGEGRRRC